MAAARAVGIPLRPAGVDLPLRLAAAIAHPLLPPVEGVAAVRTAGGESRCQVPGFRCQGTWHLPPKGVHSIVILAGDLALGT